MKFFISLLFLLWFAPLDIVQAIDQSFWRKMQLQAYFYVKSDSYKTHIRGMCPGQKKGEMEINGEPIDGTTVQSYLIRWHHAPSVYFERDKQGEAQNSYHPKTIFGFTGQGITLSGQLLVAMDLQPFRVGTGVGIRCSFLKEMVGQTVHVRRNDQNQESNLLSYIPMRSYYVTWTPLVRLGLKIVNNIHYTLLIDGTWAPCIYTFSELGKHYYWIYERNFDLGATWEKKITRYVTWSLRMAYGFCFNNEIVEAYEPINPDHLLHVGHYIGGIMAQIGISIALPGFHKCPIAGCQTKPDHTHGGKCYRNDSMFTGLW